MSCGNKSLKSCKAKSCQRFYNTTPQPFAAGQTVQLQIAGSRVVDTGISIETQPLSYTTLKTGLYHFTADVVADVTTLGTGTLQMYMDGVPLPCTLRNLRLPVGYNEIHTETDLCLTGCCCDVEHTFTFILTSVDAVGNVVQFCSGVLKLA